MDRSTKNCVENLSRMGFEFDKEFHWKYVPLYLECLCGVILQMMLLIAFLKDPLKCFRNSGVYLVANLSIADLAVCLGRLLTIVLDPENPIMEFLDHSTMLASSLALLSIAIERYAVVSHPIRYRLFIGNKKMILWVVLIWLLSFTESIKQVITNEETSHDNLVRYCFYLFSIMGTFVFYAATFHNLRKQSRSLSQLQNNESCMEYRTQKAHILKEKRFLTTIIIVGCIQVVTILPNTIYLHVVLLENRSEEREIIDVILFAIWVVNFVINPVLYVWRLPNYRKTFSIIYCNGK